MVKDTKLVIQLTFWKIKSITPSKRLELSIGNVLIFSINVGNFSGVSLLSMPLTDLFNAYNRSKLVNDGQLEKNLRSHIRK